jgi:hypothetical protein
MKKGEMSWRLVGMILVILLFLFIIAWFSGLGDELGNLIEKMRFL